MRDASFAYIQHNKRWLQPLAATLAVVGIIVFGFMTISHLWSGSYRLKVTVNVDTPDGIKTGSSVVEVTFSDGSFGLNHPMLGVSRSLSGESVVVEVAPGKYLFGLISGFPDASQVYFPGIKPLDSIGDMDPDLGPRTLGRTAIERYFTFLDINDPDSLRLVNPANMSEWFGPGTSVKNVVIEITDEEVTEGKLIKLLGWWKKRLNEDGWMSVLRYVDPKYPETQQAVGASSFWSIDRIPVKGR